jgi:hypothetical protein
MLLECRAKPNANIALISEWLHLSRFMLFLNPNRWLGALNGNNRGFIHVSKSFRMAASEGVGIRHDRHVDLGERNNKHRWLRPLRLRWARAVPPAAVTSKRWVGPVIGEGDDQLISRDGGTYPRTLGESRWRSVLVSR